MADIKCADTDHDAVANCPDKTESKQKTEGATMPQRVG